EAGGAAQARGFDGLALADDAQHLLLDIFRGSNGGSGSVHSVKKNLQRRELLVKKIHDWDYQKGHKGCKRQPKNYGPGQRAPEHHRLAAQEEVRIARVEELVEVDVQANGQRNEAQDSGRSRENNRVEAGAAGQHEGIVQAHAPGPQHIAGRRREAFEGTGYVGHHVGAGKAVEHVARNRDEAVRVFALDAAVSGTVVDIGHGRNRHLAHRASGVAEGKRRVHDGIHVVAVGLGIAHLDGVFIIRGFEFAGLVAVDGRAHLGTNLGRRDAFAVGPHPVDAHPDFGVAVLQVRAQENQADHDAHLPPHRAAYYDFYQAAVTVLQARQQAALKAGYQVHKHVLIEEAEHDDGYHQVAQELRAGQIATQRHQRQPSHAEQKIAGQFGRFHAVKVLFALHEGHGKYRVHHEGHDERRPQRQNQRNGQEEHERAHN
nr:hypothetical protein [Tanacetum cinerariifolium]